MFPKIGVPQNGWFIFIMESPIKIDDLGVSLFLETPKRLERYKPPNSFVDLNGATKMDLVKTSSIATIVSGYTVICMT